MPRADVDYLHNVKLAKEATLAIANSSPPNCGSEVFKDDESKTEAKTNSGHQVRPLLVGSPLFTCKNMHEVCSLLDMLVFITCTMSLKVVGRVWN